MERLVDDPFQQIIDLLDEVDEDFVEPEEWEPLTYPSLDLLDPQPDAKPVIPEVSELPAILRKFKLSVDIVKPISVGPILTTARIRPHGHIQLSKFKKLEEEIAFYLQVPTAHVSVDNENGTINIELPNPVPAPVNLRLLLENSSLAEEAGDLWLAERPLAFPAGVKPDGSPLWFDLEPMPHLLIGGTTGSGKSILLHSMITSILTRVGPGQVEIALIDPKRGVEFGVYDSLPHLFSPVAFDVDAAINMLYQLEREMETRYTVFQREGYRNISAYREAGRLCPFTRILCVIDELATIFEDDDSKEVENLVIRMAQLGRAAGIHLVLATQRPSHDIITGRIKANFPARVALLTASAVDSRVIMGVSGAEKLLGKGDALFHIPEHPPHRVQTCLVTRAEVTRVADWWRNKSVA